MCTSKSFQRSRDIALFPLCCLYSFHSKSLFQALTFFRGSCLPKILDTHWSWRSLICEYGLLDFLNVVFNTKLNFKLILNFKSYLTKYEINEWLAPLESEFRIFLQSINSIQFHSSI